MNINFWSCLDLTISWFFINISQNSLTFSSIDINNILCYVQHRFCSFFSWYIRFCFLYCIKLHDSWKERRILFLSIIFDKIFEKFLVFLHLLRCLENHRNLLLEISQNEVMLHTANHLKLKIANIDISKGHIKKKRLCITGKPYQIWNIWINKYHRFF